MAVRAEQEGTSTMDMQFIRGDNQKPRGHAIVIARPSSGQGHAYATYCFIPPIQVSLGSLGRYLPPIFTQQFGLDNLREMAGAPSAMPFPPMLEEIPDVDDLIAQGLARDDDIIEVRDTGDMTNDLHRMEIAAQVSAEYGQMYQRYSSSAAFRTVTPRTITPRIYDLTAEEDTPATTPGTPNIEHILHDAPSTTDTAQLGEVARLLGTLRYAIEGPDRELLEETKRALRRATAPLPEKYYADAMISAALVPGEMGQKLAELYLQRAYRLAEEDYAAIPPIEREIDVLKGQQPA